MVLLGICTAMKEYLHCTTAELVYGTSLCLSEEFFSFAATFQPLDPADFVQRMQQLRAPPVCPQQQHSKHVPYSVLTGTYILSNNYDAANKPLQPPYDGPYKVLA